VKQGNR
jgi:hypothetical protein